MGEERGGRDVSWFRRGLIIIPLVVITTAVGWWVYSTRSYAAKVREELALLRSEGGATSLADMAPRAGENGVTHYVDLGLLQFVEPNRRAGAAGQGNARFDQAASAAYEGFLQWRGFNVAPGDSEPEWNEGWLPHLEKYVAENADELKYAKEEAEAGDGCFETDWTQGPALLLPHLSALRAATRALSAEAILRARAGDARGALDDVRLMLRLRRLVDGEPILISRLVAYAMDGVATGTLHGVLDLCPADPEAARTVLAELEGREERNNLHRVLLGEAAAAIEVFDRGGPTLYALQAPGARPGIGLALRTTLGRLFWNMPKDKYSSLVLLRDLRTQAKMSVADRTTTRPALPAATGLRGMLTQMLIPPLTKALAQQGVVGLQGSARARGPRGGDVPRGEGRVSGDALSRRAGVSQDSARGPV